MTTKKELKNLPFRILCYPYRGWRMCLRFSTRNKEKIKMIEETLDELGVQRGKTQEQIEYVINVQAKGEIVKFLEMIDWDSPKPDLRNKIKAIKTIIKSGISLRDNKLLEELMDNERGKI